MKPSEESIRSDYGRAVMYARLSEMLAERPVSGSGLELGGGSNGLIQAMCPDVTWTNRDYPEFDVCEEAAWVGGYDVAVLDQVLEHVRYPWEAIAHARQNVRQALIITVPFLVKVHAVPNDFWRMTPQCIRAMAEDAGFTDIQIETWGNAKAAYWHCLYWHTPLILSNVPEPAWRQALEENDPESPFMIWAVLRP